MLDRLLFPFPFSLFLFPNYMKLVTHPDAAALAAAVATRIASDLDAALAERGRALLALAGGRTSPPVFRQLAAQPRDWSRVTILPSDERWVAANHADCNLRQMRESFAGAHGLHWLALAPDLPAGPACADFANRTLAAHPEAFDVAMLGMGTDGHFASLFPGAPTLAAGLALDAGAGCVRDALGDSGNSSRAQPAPAKCIAAIAIVPNPMPAAGPHPRISLTLARLLHSRTLLLVVTGDDKRAVLERAEVEGESSALPVAALLRAAHPRAEVHWSP
jgi:6-phosphogluconolactonase